MDTKTDILLAGFFFILYIVYLFLEAHPALLWTFIHWINGG